MFIQNQLTDEMIAADIAAANQQTETIVHLILAAVAVVVLIIGIIIAVNVIKFKKTGDSNLIGRLVKIGRFTVGPLVVCGILAFAMFLIKDDVENSKEHADEWYLVSSSVQDLISETETERVKVKRNGKTKYETRSTTYYYITFEGIANRRRISEKEYTQYTEGEEVYLIIHHTGGVRLIYPMDEYIYTGERMEEITYERTHG